MEWLLEAKTFDKMQNIKTPSAEILAQVQTNLPDIMSIVGKTASINISGILTDKREWMCFFFFGGNTTYGEIIESVNAAEANPDVTEIEFNINSPGGMASAQWIETMDAIVNMSKPSKAIVGSMGTSAAYGIATQADEIIAQNRMSYVGSVGIVTTHFVNDEIIEITSTKAPKKAPDVKTEAGKNIIKERLDAVHNIFVKAIAEGRNTTVDDVNSNYGQGAVLIAGDAINKGMIDKIGLDDSKNKSNENPTEAKMDLEELKKEHPALHQEVLDNGIDQGIKKERNRVTAHLILGTAAGAIDIAHSAIKDGTPADDVVTVAKYTVARVDKVEIDNRAAETIDTEIEKPVEETDDFGVAVVGLIEEKLGIAQS